MTTVDNSRQARRLSRLAEDGVAQTSALVHKDCKPAFDQLRSHFANPSSATELSILAQTLNPPAPVNVAQVRQLSPFRYPGGKTWLVPVTRAWLKQMPSKPRMLLEPFAGGAMVGLSAAAEGLVDQVHLVELDDDVSAVWECIFSADDQSFEKLVSAIETFDLNEQRARDVIGQSPRAIHRKAFRTIVKNRVQRGGIMAAGAGLVKTGENGRGITSRWYPETLAKRLRALRTLRTVVSFTQGDAFEAIETFPGATLFIDPPYTAAGKRAGSRLYTHNEIDHERLFDMVANNAGPALLTYDDTPEVRTMAELKGFSVGDVSMKSSHHVVMRELAIFKD